MLGNAQSGLETLRKVRHLLRMQSLSRQEMVKFQGELLQECVLDAMEHVPYYRNSASGGFERESALAADGLSRLPLTTKAIVKAHFPDQLVREGVDWEALYSVSTSGTTDRIMIFQDEERRNWDRAADLLVAWSGSGFRPGDRSLSFPPDACYEHCGADGRMVTYSLRERFQQWKSAPKDRRRQAARQLRSAFLKEYVWRSRRLPSLGVDGTAASVAVLRSYCDELESWAPRVVTGLPVTLYVLALHALREGREFPSVRVVRPNGGKFTEVMIEVVERAFGARVRENYGSAELGTVSHDCGRCREQHLFGEIFYLECLRHGEPAVEGELGEMVLTDMRNRVTPLIRYTIGDVGRLRAGHCACGFEGTRFVVDGRMEETVVSPEGRAVAGTQIVDLFLRHPGMDHVKVLQKNDADFLVEVVPGPGEEALPTDGEAGRMLSELLEHEVSVKLRKVRRIAPERSGKYRLVVSSSHERFHRG